MASVIVSPVPRNKLESIRTPPRRRQATYWAGGKSHLAATAFACSPGWCLVGIVVLRIWQHTGARRLRLIHQLGLGVGSCRRMLRVVGFLRLLYFLVGNRVGGNGTAPHSWGAATVLQGTK